MPRAHSVGYCLLVVQELMAKARALYRSASATQQEVKAGIEFSHRIYDYVFCPHTVIAFLAAQKAHQQVRAQHTTRNTRPSAEHRN